MLLLEEVATREAPGQGGSFGYPLSPVERKREPNDADYSLLDGEIAMHPMD